MLIPTRIYHHPVILRTAAARKKIPTTMIPPYLSVITFFPYLILALMQSQPHMVVIIALLIAMLIIRPVSTTVNFLKLLILLTLSTITQPFTRLTYTRLRSKKAVTTDTTTVLPTRIITYEIFVKI